MTIERSTQIEFAKEILALSEAASNDAETLKRLHTIAALVMKESGFKDNGVAFAISEYTYELLELAVGKPDTGLKDHAAETLKTELANE